MGVYYSDRSCHPLFNIFIDNLLKALRSGSRGVNMGDTKINSLIYADDIALIAKTQATLQKCLETREMHNHRNKYAFAPEKREVIAPASVLALRIFRASLSRTRNLNTLVHLIILESLSLRRVSTSN